MKKARLSPAPTQLEITLSLLRAKGYLSTLLDGKETRPLIIRSLTKEEALGEYLKSGGRTYICDELEKDMPYTIPKTKNLIVVALNFGGNIDGDGAISEMDKFSVRPLIYEEIIQYGAVYPRHQKKRSLAGIGTKHSFGGPLHSPVLSADHFGRRLDTHGYGYNWWYPCYNFLVVPK